MTKLLHFKELNHIIEIKSFVHGIICVYIYLNSGKYKVVLCLPVPTTSTILK